MAQTSANMFFIYPKKKKNTINQLFLLYMVYRFIYFVVFFICFFFFVNVYLHALNFISTHFLFGDKVPTAKYHKVRENIKDKISKRLINSCHGHNETNEYSRNSGITINTHTKANQFNNNAAEPDPAPAVHSMRALLFPDQESLCNG